MLITKKFKKSIDILTFDIFLNNKIIQSIK